MRIVWTLLLGASTLAVLPCVAAGQGTILWDRYSVLRGVWSVSISLNPEAIYVTGSSYAQTCPLGYGEWPTRAPDTFGIGLSAPRIPDGDSELIVSNGGELNAWNVKTNQLRSIWQSNAGIYSIDVSHDGSHIAVCTFDTSGVLHLIDRASGKELWYLSDATDPARFSPDGHLILTPMATPQRGMAGLALVDARTGLVLHRYYNFLNPAWGVVWDPVKPGVFAVASGDVNADGIQQSGIMDTTGQFIATAPMGAGGSASFMDFSPDGNYVVASDIGGIDLYNVPMGASMFIKSPGQTPLELAFLNNDTIVGASYSSAKLYSISAGKYVRTLSYVFSADLNFSGNGKLLLSGAGLTNAITGEPVTNYMGDDGIVNSDGSIVAGVSGEGSVGFWSALSDSAVMLQKNYTDTDNDACAAFSPTDTVFATAVDIWNSSEDPRNAVQLWDINSRSLIRTFGSERPVTALAFSHDGSMLAEVNDQGIIIWRVSDGSELYHIGATGSSLAFLPGDSALFFADEGKVDVYSLASKSLAFHPDPSINANRFALLPDGRMCVGIHRWSEDHMFEADSGVQYIDISNGNVIASFQTPDSGLLGCVAANPVTGDVAVAGQDLIVYKALGSDAVAETGKSSLEQLDAFASNSRISVRIPNLQSGKLFVYRTDGRCYFTAEVRAGESSVTTPVLPAGDYFIVFEQPNGRRAFTKVSLF